MAGRLCEGRHRSARGHRYRKAVAFYTERRGFKPDRQHPPAFARVSVDDFKLILSGPDASGSRPMPDGNPIEVLEPTERPK